MSAPQAEAQDALRQALAAWDRAVEALREEIAGERAAGSGCELYGAIGWFQAAAAAGLGVVESPLLVGCPGPGGEWAPRGGVA